MRRNRSEFLGTIFRKIKLDNILWGIFKKYDFLPRLTKPSFDILLNFNLDLTQNVILLVIKNTLNLWLGESFYNFLCFQYSASLISGEF